MTAVCDSSDSPIPQLTNPLGGWIPFGMFSYWVMAILRRRGWERQGRLGKLLAAQDKTAGAGCAAGAEGRGAAAAIPGNEHGGISFFLNFSTVTPFEGAVHPCRAMIS